MAKDPRAYTFLEHRTLVPQAMKIGQIDYDIQRDFTIKFTWHPTESESNFPGIVSFHKPQEPTSNVWSTCFPCFQARYRGIRLYLYFTPTSYKRLTVHTGLILNQDNEVKLTVINGAIRFYINGVLKNKNVAPSSYNNEIHSSLEVYSHFKQSDYYRAKGYLQNVQYIPGGQAA